MTEERQTLSVLRGDTVTGVEVTVRSSAPANGLPVSEHDERCGQADEGSPGYVHGGRRYCSSSCLFLALDFAQNGAE